MEYETFYKYPEFEKALKVNSVWLCPAAPEEREGSVLTFRLGGEEKTEIAGLPPPGYYDKLRLVFVNTGGVSGPVRRDICGFIWALTTTALSAGQRKSWLKEKFGMDMTETIEKKVDEYDWMLVSYGEKRFEEEKKQCREEGRVEKSESIARNMLRSNYLPEEISRMTGLDIARINQLAKESKQ